MPKPISELYESKLNFQCKMITVGWIRAKILILFPIVRRQIGRAFDTETIFKSHGIIKYEWLNHCSSPEAGRT